MPEGCSGEGAGAREQRARGVTARVEGSTQAVDARAYDPTAAYDPTPYDPAPSQMGIGETHAPALRMWLTAHVTSCACD